MAKRTLNRLTDLEVRRAKEPGMYADGGGLYLKIDPRRGDRRWVFVFHLAGKRSEMTLGSPPAMTLAEARNEREACRKLVKVGESPILARQLARQAAIARQTQTQTFAEWAREVAPSIAPPTLKSHAAWLKMMTEWVGPLKDKPPRSIKTEDVQAALKPYWKTRPEQGRKMRLRIEAVLDAAKAKGMIPDPWANPARWKGHLQVLMPRQDDAVKHHRALPYAEMPAFMAELRAKEPMSARALEFTVLTAARTSETIYAVWSELDLKAGVWIVPKERMKGRREHRVPLTDAALKVLETVMPPNGHKPGDWVFPSLFRRGKPLSTAAMERMLQDMGYGERATVHGMRSAFRDWAGDCTDHMRDTIEAALAHVVGDDTERAYRRGDALQKRRALMEDWAAFLATPPARQPDQATLGELQPG